MKPETPATGILKTSDFGLAKFYHIHCDCGSDECAHEIEIEADDTCVQVHIYHTLHTKWWEKSRWKQLWQLITTGYIDAQSTIVMDEQTALNYSAILKSAMEDVKQFRESRVKK